MSDQDWLYRISPCVHIASSAPAPPDWVEPLRVLYDHELVLFSEGRFVVEIGDTSYDCPAGTYIVIPPGCAERSSAVGDAPGKRHWVHFDWDWRPSMPGAPVMTYSPLPLEADLLRPAPDFVPKGVLYGRIRHIDRALALHEQLETRWDSSDAHEQLLSRAVLLELLCDLFGEEDSRKQIEPPLHTLLTRVLRRLRELADAPLCATPPIRQELPKLGYSYGHLLKLFKAQFGITPIEYVTALRMERAKRLLRTTTLTIAEVGYQLGIDNPPYFTRLFRRCTGVTPSAFRGSPRPASRPGGQRNSFLH